MITFQQTDTTGVWIQSGFPVRVACTGIGPILPIGEQAYRTAEIGGTAGTGTPTQNFTASQSRINITWICQIPECYKLPAGTWTVEYIAESVDVIWKSTYICYIYWDGTKWTVPCGTWTACTIASNVSHNTGLGAFAFPHTYSVNVTQSTEWIRTKPIDAIYVCLHCQNTVASAATLKYTSGAQIISPAEYMLCPSLYPEWRPHPIKEGIVAL